MDLEDIEILWEYLLLLRALREKNKLEQRNRSRGIVDGTARIVVEHNGVSSQEDEVGHLDLVQSNATPPV